MTYHNQKRAKADGLVSKRQVRLADDIAECVDAAREAGEGRSMAEVVDRILRAEFRRREGSAEPVANIPASMPRRVSAGVHKPRGRMGFPDG